jgi:predicted metalloprotease
VDDRRGRQVRRGFAGGGIGTIVLILAALYFGIDPTPLLQGLEQTKATGPAAPAGPRPDDELAEFVAVVLADTEATWRKEFADQGRQYQEPVLVLFTDAVNTACGLGQSAMGPFYCPGDQRIYIDLGFYRDLRDRFKAPGDFAQAYVVAHEVGHHVQNLLGVSGQVAAERRRVSQAAGNQLSVRLELQADCLAGVWGNHAGELRDLLEDGDIEEGLNAASAIGDDRIQRQSSGRVVPDSFTHGSSEQRVRWFKRGLESGQLANCDSFAERNL